MFKAGVLKKTQQEQKVSETRYGHYAEGLIRDKLGLKRSLFGIDGINSDSLPSKAPTTANEQVNLLVQILCQLYESCLISPVICQFSAPWSTASLDQDVPEHVQAQLGWES